MEDSPWLCCSLFRSSRGYTIERGCSQTLQILTPRLGSSHALVGMGEAFPAPAMPLSPGKSLRDSPLGICGAQLEIALTFYLPKASCPPGAVGMALSGVRANNMGSGFLALLVLIGPCNGGEKQAPLWKTPSIRGKADAQTHGFPQSPGGDLFKGTLKDLWVLKERNEGNRAE